MGGVIAARLESRDNALNFVRLILAVFVLTAHAWPLSGLTPDWLPEPPPLGFLGVAGFFTISGYLVSRSRARLTLGAFLSRRARRIFPGYWAALLFVAVIAAPVSLLLSDAELDLASAALYPLLNATLFQVQYGVSDTLMGNPYPDVWNGSLWTLAHEVGAYLLAAVVVATPLMRRAPLVCAVLLHVFFATLAYQTHAAGAHLPYLFAFFTAGMVLWALGDRLQVTWWGIAAACLMVTAALIFGTLPWLGPLPIAYLTLAAGAALPTRLCSRNDISYGAYLYAFPIQQLLALAGAARFGVVGFAVASAALTLPVAAASWFLIERPALRGRRWSRPSRAIPRPADAEEVPDRGAMRRGQPKVTERL